MTAQKLKIPYRVVSVFVAICLVFSCFSVLSVPADATAAVAGGLVIIGGVVGVGIILQAMGVRPTGGSSSASWQSLCSSAYAYLQTLSYATVKGIPLATREGRAYVMRDVISALRDWLYSSKTISQPITEYTDLGTVRFKEGTYSFALENVTSPVRRIAYYALTGYRSDGLPQYQGRVYYYSASSFYYRYNDPPYKNWMCASTMTSNYDYMFNGYLYIGESSDVSAYFLSHILPTASEPLTDLLADGLYFDVIRPDFGTDIETTYETWGNTARVVEFPDPDATDPDDPDDDPPKVPKPGWPIWFPKFGGIEFPDGMPQREIQDPDYDPDLDPEKDPGNVPDPSEAPDPSEDPNREPDPDPDPEPDPDPDPQPTVKPEQHDPTDPTRNPDPPPDPDPPDPQRYGVDLTKYFPFCIPFDIYKMLSLLSAEPETPHFTVTLFGKQTTIELRMFDGVAAVARTMETLLFAVTLAAGTKKLIGW